MNRAFFSLRLKLTATAVLLVVLVVAVFAALSLQSAKRDVETQTERLVRILNESVDEVGTSSTRYLALPAASPMYDNDLRGLYSLIQPSVMQSSGYDVVYAFVVATNGRVWIASADPSIDALLLGEVDSEAQPFYRRSEDPFAPQLIESLPQSYLARYESLGVDPVKESVERTLIRQSQSEKVELLQFTSAIVDRNDKRLGYLSLAYSLDTLQAQQAEIRAEGEAKKDQLRQRIALLGGLAVALGCIIAILQALAITRNVKKLSKAARQIAQGNLSVRATVSARDEIGLLGQQFNFMADRVQALLVETQAKAMLDKELDIARAIQEALVPAPGLTEASGIRFAGFFRSASVCGGDFWSYTALENGELLLSIGDVTGHGVPSAMISAAAKSGLDTLVNISHGRLELPNLLDELNKTIYDTAKRKFVMTFMAMKLDTRAGKLRVANAGHNFPIIARRMPNGNVEAKAMVVRGNRLGDERSSQYYEIEMNVLPGDLLVMYTDGLTEFRNTQGFEYGERRLRRLLVNLSQLEPDDILARILADLGEHAVNAPQEDDVTIVVAKIRS